MMKFESQCYTCIIKSAGILSVSLSLGAGVPTRTLQKQTGRLNMSNRGLEEFPARDPYEMVNCVSKRMKDLGM